MIEGLAAIIATTVQSITSEVVRVIPNLVIAIALIVLGWIVGVAFSRIVAQVVDTLKIDGVLRSAGFDKIVERSGHRLNAGALLGGLVKWFIISIFLVIALEVLNLTQVTAFLSQVVFFYLPQVIVAVLILLIAAVVADFASSAAISAAKAAEIGSPYFVGSVARWAIWIFAILAALDQLSVATAFVQTLFTGIVVAVSLALGLSFGLGGQAAASRYIERVSSELTKKSPNHTQHPPHVPHF